MADDREPPPAIVPIPEIREYPRINAELTRLLDAGHPRVVLAGADGHRLLILGLAGPWRATVEVEGRAGPELAAEMDAPGVTVVCRGNAADGAARGLRSGKVIVLGDAGEATAYGQRGGSALVAGSAGNRAGLRQSGGVLVLLGAVGRLAGERQSGGELWAIDGRLGPHAGRGRRGGRLVLVGPGDLEGGDAPRAEEFRAALREFGPWVGPPRPS